MTRDLAPSLLVLALATSVHAQEPKPPAIVSDRTIPFEPLEPQQGGCRTELTVATGELVSNSPVYPRVTAIPNEGYLVSGRFSERRILPQSDDCGIYWHYTFIRKYNADWSTRWTAYLTSEDAEYYGQAAPTADGGVVVSGAVTVEEPRAAHFIARFDSDGTERWRNVFTPIIETFNWEGDSLPIETADGGYAHLALEKVGTNDGTWFLLRTESTGDLRWIQPVLRRNGIPLGIYGKVALRETSDEGFTVFVDGHGRGRDRLLQTDSSGEVKWDRTLTEDTVCVNEPWTRALWFRHGRQFSVFDSDEAFVCALDAGGCCILQQAADEGWLAGTSDRVIRFDRTGRELWRWEERNIAAQAWLQEPDGGFLRVRITGSLDSQIQLTKLAPEPFSSPNFLRGDCNDDGGVDISDAVCVLNWLLLGGATPGCIAVTNTNGDEGEDISDATYLLNHLFLGGPAPVAPFAECGPGTLPTDEGTCEMAPKNCPQ